MRVILIELSLLLCLALAGCVGRGQAAARTAGQPRNPSAVSIVATPTPTGPGVDILLKASDSHSSKPTPTAVATSNGPMSCVDRRLRALQQGKLLPTNQCSP